MALLGLQRRSRVIDAGCGEGRISVRLASLGHDVVAIDHDEAQVERARTAAAARGVELDLRVADLTEHVVDPSADAAVMWFTTFGFLSDEENRQVLANIRRGLRVGAPFLVDTLDPRQVAADLSEDPDPFVIEVDGAVQSDARRFDPGSSRLIVERTVVGPSGATRRNLRLWLPDLDEWPAVLRSAGFALQEIVTEQDDAWSIRVLSKAI